VSLRIQRLIIAFNLKSNPKTSGQVNPVEPIYTTAGKMIRFIGSGFPVLKSIIISCKMKTSIVQTRVNVNSNVDYGSEFLSTRRTKPHP